VALGLIRAINYLNYEPLIDPDSQALIVLHPPFSFLYLEMESWLIAVICIPIVMIVSKLSFIQILFNKIAEAVSIFIYIYLPISIVSCFVVLFRNIW